jgi:two-component system, LuxR family, response regulator FixJ
MHVYLVDDDQLVLASLRATLESLFSVQTFEDAEAFLAVVERLLPGVVLIDVELPGMSGCALHAELTHRNVPMTVVFLTGRGGVPHAVDAMRRGAVDFLCKPMRRVELLFAVENAAARLDVVLEKQGRLQLLSCLTDREREVLQGMATGAPSKVIAYQLEISPRTVEMHRARICRKLGVPAAAAVALACDTGLVTLLRQPA